MNRPKDNDTTFIVSHEYLRCFGGSEGIGDLHEYFELQKDKLPTADYSQTQTNHTQ
jgi:hypothetical protein